MESKTSEMSLDEVLSSIKRMVIDKEPPVLELTEMVSEDGSVISVKKKNELKSEKNIGNDMGTFLKLIQADASGSAKENVEIPAVGCECSRSDGEEKKDIYQANNGNMLYDLVKETITPLLRDWLEKNLPSVIGRIVETEVKNFLYKSKN